MSIAESFAQSSVARLVNSAAGRLARIIAGIGLVGWGYMQRDSNTGLVLMGVGIIPLTAGAFNLCLISALLGGPIGGARHNQA